ncbi:hypothetical protein CCP2SC5_480006 [Azospirillaceae bacterium]
MICQFCNAIALGQHGVRVGVIAVLSCERFSVGHVSWSLISGFQLGFL